MRDFVHRGSDGCRLNATALGQGPALVLPHGGGAGRHRLLPLARRLAGTDGPQPGRGFTLDQDAGAGPDADPRLRHQDFRKKVCLRARVHAQPGQRLGRPVRPVLLVG